MPRYYLIWLFFGYVNTAVLRSYSPTGNFHVVLSRPLEPNSRTKVEIRSVRAYNTTQGYSPYRYDNGSIIVPFATIADDDIDARSPDGSTWTSVSKHGFVFYSPTNRKYEVTWVSENAFTGKLNYGGRGMELSDLCFFDGHIFTADDKTGVVYQIIGNSLNPFAIISDTDSSHLPFKAEWMTVKNDELYVGSLGTEVATNTSDLNYHFMYVKIINRFGEVRTENWVERYQRMRSFLGLEYPSYLSHESCQWSDIHHKWFFLPRKVSTEAYDDIKDQTKGSNYLIIANENFTSFESYTVGVAEPTRGFSAFQFLPYTNDTMIIAIKTEEIENRPLASYVMIFQIDGRVLMQETLIPGEHKFEGLAFVNWSN